MSTICFNQSFPKNFLYLVSSSTGQLQNERDGLHDMRTQRPRKGPPLPPLTHAPPGVPGDGLSPWGEPVTLQFTSLAFQFHRQMVGGALAQTEHLSPQTPTDVWAPTTQGDPIPLAISSAPLIHPGNHKFNAKCSSLRLLFSTLQPQKRTKAGLPHAGPLTHTQNEFFCPFFNSSKTHLRNYPPELQINTRCQADRMRGCRSSPEQRNWILICLCLIRLLDILIIDEHNTRQSLQAREPQAENHGYREQTIN